MDNSVTPGGIGALDLAHELERLSRASVTVLGDVTLERRVSGSLGGGAMPGPLLLGGERAEPGGGAAIVRALAALRVSTALICVLGDDLPGAELTALIGAQPNVEPWLLVDGAKATTTETSYVDGESVVLRTLRNDRRPMQPNLRERMLRIAGDAMTATSVTVLSDRGHGMLDAETIALLLGGARQAGRRIVADLERGGDPPGHFRGCDVLVKVAADDDPEGEAEAVRTSCDVPVVLLAVPEGGVAIADRDGADRLTGPGWSGRPAGYAHLVAAYAAALATGSSPRLACRIACGLTPPEARS